MKYNFDEIIDRKNSDSIKWDATKIFFGEENVLPMWVADMDFRTPPFIIHSIEKQLKKSVLGYTFAGEEWYTSIIQWLKHRHNWEISKSSLTFIPGIVRGQAHILQCFTEINDKVMVMSPVYHPFFQVTTQLQRQVVFSSLCIENNQINIDFNRFEKDIKGCKVLILCNPHNPGGRVWSKDELQRIAQICHKNNVLVISDEIHADLTLPSYKHHPLANVSPEAAEITITLMAPSKTFNMPGISSSFAVVENDILNTRFQTFMQAGEFNHGNMFAYASAATAYSQGEDWLTQLLQYLQKNIDFTEHFLKTELPCISMIRPQASFLIFLNCKELKLKQSALEHLFLNEAHLALNSGTMFGIEGEGFMRLNVGCPRETLQKALEQLKFAINKR